VKNVPSIGRIVHFVQNGVHYAALIVKVWSDTCVNLQVFPNGSDHIVPGALDSTQPRLLRQLQRADVVLRSREGLVVALAGDGLRWSSRRPCSRRWRTSRHYAALEVCVALLCIAAIVIARYL
jgi:hypothetical protein